MMGRRKIRRRKPAKSREFLVDSVDDLDVSIGELSIDGKCDKYPSLCTHGVFIIEV